MRSVFVLSASLVPLHITASQTHTRLSLACTGCTHWRASHLPVFHYFSRTHDTDTRFCSSEYRIGVLFCVNNAVSCCYYILSVIDKWLWSCGGIALKSAKWRTRRKLFSVQLVQSQLYNDHRMYSWSSELCYGHEEEFQIQSSAGHLKGISNEGPSCFYCNEH